jgi:hypothetical protein
VIAGISITAILMHSLVTARDRYRRDRDQNRRDFAAMSEQAAELEVRHATLLLAANRVLADVEPSRTRHVVVSMDVIDVLAAAVRAASDAGPTPTGHASADEASP